MGVGVEVFVREMYISVGCDCTTGCPWVLDIRVESVSLRVGIPGYQVLVGNKEEGRVWV